MGNEPHAMPRLMRLADVMTMTDLSKTTIYDGIKAGTFPAPVKYGVASRWVESEIADWINALKAERRPELP